MREFILFFLLSLPLYASLDHFPEDRYYVPRVDTGYTQYNTPSILGRDKIVLTFDDGPHPVYTDQILDILKKHQVKATFFVLTHKFTSRNERILQRILKEGHLIASHDHYHNRNDYVTRDEFESNLETSIKLIARLYQRAGIEQPGFWYRFPYAQYGGNENYHHMNSILSISEKLFNDNCINFAFWDIDSGDWIPGLSSTQVFKNIQAFIKGGAYMTYTVRNGQILQRPAYNENALNGGVILQHDIQKRTVRATEMLIEYAKQNQIEITPLNELEEFSYQGKDCRIKL
tara:strand:+ start:6325 stop:7188 length:864 start_codon:yes stop_codon:yes gene_type:complete